MTIISPIISTNTSFFQSNICYTNFENLPGKLALARPTPRAAWRAAPRAPAAPPRPALLAAAPRAGGPPARPRATTPRPRPAYTEKCNNKKMIKYRVATTIFFYKYMCPNFKTVIYKNFYKFDVILNGSCNSDTAT